MGEQMGSVAFKNYIVDAIQENDVEDTLSPNPMSEEDLKAADRYARAFARKAYPVIKQKIQAQGAVIGIGRLFYHSIRPLASEDGVITRKGLRRFIEDSLNKTDEELNNPFAHVDVSNCILTLAIMKALHIQKIRPTETTTTRGLLVSPTYWVKE
jgi:exopolyphosphatase/guanosine-5'-triphosphate,3'-diphosphate pyrophosphatase